MAADEISPSSLEALAYLRAWCTETYNLAELQRSLAIRERDDDSSTDRVRQQCADRARQTEDLAGHIGHAVELLERGLAEQRKRGNVRHYRFADAGAWVPGELE